MIIWSKYLNLVVIMINLSIQGQLTDELILLVIPVLTMYGI